MFVFVIYALVTWYLAFRYRRHWGALLTVFVAALGLSGMWLLHAQINEWSGAGINRLIMRLLLAPYSVLVVVFGVFLALLPKVPNPDLCRVCSYDLTGLGNDPRCPECGNVVANEEPAIPATPAAALLDPRNDS